MQYYPCSTPAYHTGNLCGIISGFQQMAVDIKTIVILLPAPTLYVFVCVVFLWRPKALRHATQVG